MSTFDEFIEAVKSQNYEVIQAGIRNDNISVSAHDKNEKCALEYAIDFGDMKASWLTCGIWAFSS